MVARVERRQINGTRYLQYRYFRKYFYHYNHVTPIQLHPKRIPKTSTFPLPKAVRKYPNKMQDNRFALKLLSLAIQIYLYAMYSVLIYFIITLVLPYKR